AFSGVAAWYLEPSIHEELRLRPRPEHRIRAACAEHRHQRFPADDQGNLPRAVGSWQTDRRLRQRQLRGNIRARRPRLRRMWGMSRSTLFRCDMRACGVYLRLLHTAPNKDWWDH